MNPPEVLLSIPCTAIDPPAELEDVPVTAETFEVVVAWIIPALKAPEASRFTIALAVLALVGATLQFSPNVPAVVTGEPLTLKSEFGALKPTLVTEAAPDEESDQPQEQSA